MRGRADVLLLLAAMGLIVLFLAFAERETTPSPSVENPQVLLAGEERPTVGPIEPKTAPTRLSTALPTARATVELRAPDNVVGGTEFTLAVRIANDVTCEGWVELAFDPGVMTLADASVRHESSGDGAIRIHVGKLATQTFSASLQFVSSFSASAPAIVRVTGAELVSQDGRPIGISLPPARQIAILVP